MDGRNIEPRNVMWAVAEITWEDDGGTSIRVPAILEEDGGDFLLGVRREADIVRATKPASHRAAPDAKAGSPAENSTKANPANSALPQTALPAPVRLPEPGHAEPGPKQPDKLHPRSRRALTGVVETSPLHSQTEIHNQGTSPRPTQNDLSPFLAP